jgi:hypothetical protein
MSPLRVLPAVFLAFAIARFSAGEEIKVTPGAGALVAALAKAKAGDVIKVGAGEYPESVRVPGSVTIEGAGADRTTLVGTDYAVIDCTGAHTRIVGLTIRGGEKTVRGVNAERPLRLERCRFLAVNQAVGLMAAPLSDIVACEFIDCGVGVRAILASPTVWGCAFKGGTVGIVSIEGAPYVRNNLFQGMKKGLGMDPGKTEPAIIRNNLFIGCEEAAVVLRGGRERLSAPSMRNMVVVHCGAAVIAPKDLVSRVSHAVLHRVRGSAFRDPEGMETLRIGEAAIQEGDAGITVENEFRITVSNGAVVEARGVRLPAEPKGTRGIIGLDQEWRQVGVSTPTGLPPIRFAGMPFIANSVHEEYQYLEVLGRRKGGTQALLSENGIMVDRLQLEDGREPAELIFDVSRFYSESELAP